MNWTIPIQTCKGQTSSITAVGAAKLQNKGCLQELEKENIWDLWKSHLACELMTQGEITIYLAARGVDSDPVSSVYMEILGYPPKTSFPPSTLEASFTSNKDSISHEMSFWLCSHTSCIHTAAWSWFHDFLLVCLTTVTARTFHYSLLNAAPHHMPK